MAKRRISSKLPIQEALGVVAGAIAAALVGKAITAAMPTAKPAIKALIPVGLGIFLAGMKSPIIKGAGFGMIAKGGSSLVEAFAPAGMFGGDEFALSGEYDYLNAPADQSILSAPADQSILSEYYMNGDDSMQSDEIAMMNGSDESEF
jgi:hypothetical protein